MTARIQVTEQNAPNGQTVYHWQIIDGQGKEFAHSSYHLDLDECVAEGDDRLAEYQRQGWIQ